MVQTWHLGAGTGRVERCSPKKAKRRPYPHVVILDAQSDKTDGRRQARSFDGGKWVKGRKRQIAVASLGLLLGVRVHAANGAGSRENLQLFKRLLFKFPKVCLAGLSVKPPSLFRIIRLKRMLKLLLEL